jgi:hypothetical protein
MIDTLTIADIKAIKKRLVWTDEFKADGQLWLAEARKIRDEYKLTDQDVLNIANNRIKL